MNWTEKRFILRKVVNIGPIPVTVEYEATRDSDGHYKLYRVNEAFVEDFCGRNRVDLLDCIKGEDYQWLERQLDPDSDAVIDEYVYDHYDGPDV